MSVYIVQTGTSIKIDVNGNLRLERSCEEPGCVTILGYPGERITLPTNKHEMENFIAAYRRACEEDVPYRKREVENGP